MTKEREIQFLNEDGIELLKATLCEAWEYVSKTGNEVELSGISPAILEDILEEYGVDLSTSFCDGDCTFVEYNTDYIHFYLDINTGTLNIYSEKPKKHSTDGVENVVTTAIKDIKNKYPDVSDDIIQKALHALSTHYSEK